MPKAERAESTPRSEQTSGPRRHCNVTATSAGSSTAGRRRIGGQDNGRCHTGPNCLANARSGRLTATPRSRHVQRQITHDATQRQRVVLTSPGSTSDTDRRLKNEAVSITSADSACSTCARPQASPNQRLRRAGSSEVDTHVNLDISPNLLGLTRCRTVRARPRRNASPPTTM